MTIPGRATIRPATAADIPEMEALIARSGIALSKGFYTDEQAQAVTRHVFGVDTQLIKDGTYFVVERDGALLACGGWSKRATLFGADRTKADADPLLDPAAQPGRIRAFFVDPSVPRQGLGTMLIRHCEAEAARQGFTTLEMAATMPGVPLYRSVGYETVEEFAIDLPGGVSVPLARMRKRLA
jgi:GNAT superfamily N-acetyltransferase